MKEAKKNGGEKTNKKRPLALTLNKDLSIDELTKLFMSIDGRPSGDEQDPYGARESFEHYSLAEHIETDGEAFTPTLVSRGEVYAAVRKYLRPKSRAQARYLLWKRFPTDQWVNYFPKLHSFVMLYNNFRKCFQEAAPPST